MDATHILLGRSWLYDLDVINFGRSNAYELKINGKRIVLKPAKPKSNVGTLGSHKTRIVTDKESKKPLHVVTRSQFLKESKEGISVCDIFPL